MIGIEHSLWERVFSAAPGSLLFPAQLGVDGFGSTEEVRRILSCAAKLRFVRPVYMLNTTRSLIGLENRWRPDLPALRQVYRYADGSGEIDGRDPKNILVAFERYEPEETGP